MKFQVEASVSARGYVEVEADDAESAKKEVLRNAPYIEWRADIGTTLFDERGDVNVGSVEAVEEEDEA